MEFTGDGRAGISVGYGRPYPLPVVFDLVERHPLGSQAFVLKIRKSQRIFPVSLSKQLQGRSNKNASRRKQHSLP